MAKKNDELVLDPWDRQPGEGQKPYEAFCAYRDMGDERSTRKVAQALSKSASLISRWSSTYNWVARIAAWDDEIARQVAREQLKDIANTRKRQRANAKRMQDVGMDLLNALANRGYDVKMSEVVSLLKAGMEQERIALGDVGEVIEERNGEATPAVQIYIPDNGRGRDKDDFSDLDV